MDKISNRFVKLFKEEKIFLSNENHEAEVSSPPLTPKKIAIVGAGAAGIAALCVIARSKIKHDVTAFEAREVIGGLWVYDEGRGPMYKNLKTNLGKEAMTMPGFPFESFESYVTHVDVVNYLQMCFDNVNGEKYTKFNHWVCSAVPTSSGQWEVSYRPTKSNKSEVTKEIFDYVFACSGRYDSPVRPEIPGLLDNFRGRLLHSWDYREPEYFKGESVLILGAGNSGQDIAAELVPHASQIILSHNQPRLTATFPDNMVQVHGLSEILPTELLLNDGSSISHPDVILLATGYCLTFPYLRPEHSATIDRDFAFPLYKQFISIRRPSLFLYGICINVAPIPLFYMQSQFALAIIEGRHSLPSRLQMLDELKTEIREKMPTKMKSIHVQTHEQWTLTIELARLSGVEALTPDVTKVFYSSDYMRRHHLMYYRSYNFETDNPWGKVKMRPINGAPEIPEALQLSTMPSEILNYISNRPRLRGKVVESNGVSEKTEFHEMQKSTKVQ